MTYASRRSIGCLLALMSGSALAAENWALDTFCAEVQRVTAANDVQVVAHCVGSMSFLMAQLAGMTGVRAAVLSALTAHPRAPALTEKIGRAHV